MNERQPRVAVFIDCDNIAVDYIDPAFKLLEEEGRRTICRGYGDFSKRALHGWKEACQKLAIVPVQQFAKKNKQSTDMALICDLIELLYADQFDVVCLATGDSDYTYCVKRIRERGKVVIGLADRRKASEDLITACDRFIYADELLEEHLATSNASPEATSETSKANGRTRRPRPSRVHAISETSKDDGAGTPTTDLAAMIEDCLQSHGRLPEEWTRYSTVGQYLRSKVYNFSWRSYGYKTMGDALESMSDRFETRGTGPDSSIRMRKRSSFLRGFRQRRKEK